MTDVLSACWITLRCWWEAHASGWYVLWLLVRPLPLPRRTLA